jgi:c-di-GMP-related signal transduction protein
MDKNKKTVTNVNNHVHKNVNNNEMLKNPLRRKFVARQPIFDREKCVVAYELLFRSGFDNVFTDFAHQDDASSKTLVDSFLLFDINQLAGGNRVFVNVTRNVLLGNWVEAFPGDLLVVELLENIEPDERVIDVCRRLKEQKYTLALDDFVFRPEFRPLMDFMDIVKIDFLETKDFHRKDVFYQINRENIAFLAEKVETMEDFQQAKDIGYTYFQGYFFSKPLIMYTRDIPSTKANLLKLLNRIHQPEADFREIESIIKKDVSLAYKLIRFVNSAAFGLSVEVHSIKHVLNLLGLYELRRWISLVVMAQLSEDEPEELMVSSLVRARFCELAAEEIGMKEQSGEFFLMGLFSLIDAIFERPMEVILDELPLCDEIKQALLRDEGLFGDVLKMVKAYERGDWKTIFDITARINLSEEVIPEIYFETIVWANALKSL